MSKDNGGPAFPVIDPDIYPAPSGMTLRDYFAAKALQGLLAMEANPAFGDSCEPYRNHGRCDLMAADAYGLADAMIAERAK